MRRFVTTKNATTELTVLGNCAECDKEYELTPDWDGSPFLCSGDCFVDSLATPESRKKLTELMKDHTRLDVGAAL